VNDADAILDALRIPQEAQEFATYPDGLFLITGTTGAGKTTTGLALMRRAQVDKGRAAFAIMDSREALGPRLGSTTLIPVYGQGEYPAAIREAVERGARVMFVDGLYDPETIKAAVDASLSGVLVFATMHSRPEDALQRLQDDFQGDGAAQAQERVRQAVRGVVGVQIHGAGPVRGVLAAEVWVKGDEDEASLQPVLTFEESRAALTASEG
jgi:Tfp pilus assembly pilus retraction ATPase PilT